MNCILHDVIPLTVTAHTDEEGGKYILPIQQALAVSWAHGQPAVGVGEVTTAVIELLTKKKATHQPQPDTVE